MPELEIYGDIGEDWFGEGITAKSVSQWLRENARNADEITVRINSYGGWVSEGVAIYNILSSHKARVITLVDGFALSAASVIAMAGDEIHMRPGSMMMIHNAAGGAWGQAEDLESAASALRKMSDAAAGIYALRTSKPKEECAALMAAETWFTPDEALAAGFCDKIASGKADTKSAKRANSQRAQAFLNMYRKAPETLRAALCGAPEQRSKQDAKPRLQTPQMTVSENPFTGLAHGGFSARLGR